MAAHEQKIVPCLWFNDQAEEAVEFYTATFGNSKVLGNTLYDESSSRASGMKKGSVMTIPFVLEGYELLALNGGPHFQFTQALSFIVSCSSEKEIDSLWEKLSDDGTSRIELKEYPFAEKYGWCEDRFGLSWQLIYSQRGEKQNQKIAPALLFVQEQAGRAQEAMEFYTSLFPDSKIAFVARDEKTDVILHGRFTLNGESFVAFESPMKHDFRFNHSVSLTVRCEDQAEIDRYWAKLSADKREEQCGWLKDKFGVSWQIVPATMKEIMLDPDAKKRERVMAAVLKMKKLDLETLKKAEVG